MDIKKIVLLLLLAGCSPAADNQATAATRARVGQPAPEFTLNTVDGKTVSLKDFKGKAVLLDFWATWCPPCRMSTPAVIELHKKYQGKDVAVVGISVDEDVSEVKPYLLKAKAPHLVLLAGDSGVDQQYGVRAIPTFYILDKDGTVRKQYSGFYPGMEKEWAEQLDALLLKPAKK